MSIDRSHRHRAPNRATVARRWSGGDPKASTTIGFAPVENYPETLPGPARAAMGIDGPGRVFDTVLEGRASYKLGLTAGMTDAYPHLRHLVFSTTLATSPDPAVEIVAADALERVRALKAEPGLDLWLVGGGTIDETLLESGLRDLTYDRA